MGGWRLGWRKGRKKDTGDAEGRSGSWKWKRGEKGVSKGWPMGAREQEHVWAADN